MFRKLGQLARHLGKNIVHFSENALGKMKHIGKQLYDKAGSVPVIGGILQKGMDMAYSTRIPGIGLSAKDVMEGADRAVQWGKKLVDDDPDVRHEGYRQALSGERGATVQRGAQAVSRIAEALT